MNGELRLVRWWQAIGWLLLALVIVLSLLPHPPKLDLPRLLAWDKAQHALAYATLVAWFQQCSGGRWRWPLGLVTLGIAIEYLQLWSGHRDFEYADMLADAIGVAGGLLVIGHTPLGRLLPWLDRMLAASRPDPRS